jgi:hypothetical protein
MSRMKKKVWKERGGRAAGSPIEWAAGGLQPELERPFDRPLPLSSMLPLLAVQYANGMYLALNKETMNACDMEVVQWNAELRSTILPGCTLANCLYSPCPRYQGFGKTERRGQQLLAIVSMCHQDRSDPACLTRLALMLLDNAPHCTTDRDLRLLPPTIHLSSR